MSQMEDDDSKPYTEHDLKEAIRRINAGEINFKEAENYYGISPRTIHRQRAIENMRAQLNPEKSKKLKAAAASTARKDITVLRKPVEISCSSLSDVASLLKDGTDEVKQLLDYECDLIYECKVCKNLFRSLLNFISHKRIYCCDMYSVAHTRSDENGDAAVATNPTKVEEKFKAKEDIKEFTSRPFRITCRKDLTTVLKRITTLSSEFVSAEPILHLQNMENTACALQQVIRPNPSASEPLVQSTESERADKNVQIQSTVSQVEPKEEITPKVQTPQEKIEAPKKIVVTKSSNIVHEKRFKCPACPSHFSTKKSVFRHLKSVHHKSDEQVDRLKSRIQLFVVKIKKDTSAKTKRTVPSIVPKPTSSTSPPSLVKPSSAVPSTSSKESTTSPASSTKSDSTLEKADAAKRTSRKNASSDDADSTSASDSEPKLPVVSLTPVNAQARLQKSESTSTTKKLTTTASQKRSALPPSSALSTLSSSKKIGIQVRMNYCKGGINQSPSTASFPPVGLAVPPTLSQASSDNSRRSSTVSLNRDEKPEGSKTDLMNGHNTRSSKGKLAHILKSLLEKQSSKDENKDPKSGTAKCSDELCDVSVYCVDCETAYALNDQRWASGNGSPPTFKCALPGCDFRSNNSNELLPHVSTEHVTRCETAVPEQDWMFSVESSGAGKFCCHRGGGREQSLESRKRDRGVLAPASAPTKRKSNSESVDRSTKRRMALSVNTKFAAALETADKTAAMVWKNTNNNERKVMGRARRRVMVDAVGIRNVVPNGLQTSGDVTTRTLKKQNPLLGELKVTSKSPKMNAVVDSTLFPLTPDSGLDPATMSEEILKKSVMTIIFGKDMPDENVDSNIVDNREKSPDSSTTSSDNGREKRYGLRASKPVGAATKKVVGPSLPEYKDDTILKVQQTILNKMKSASR